MDAFFKSRRSTSGEIKVKQIDNRGNHCHGEQALISSNQGTAGERQSVTRQRLVVTVSLSVGCLLFCWSAQRHLNRNCIFHYFLFYPWDNSLKLFRLFIEPPSCLERSGMNTMITKNKQNKMKQNRSKSGETTWADKHIIVQILM